MPLLKQHPQFGVLSGHVECLWGIDHGVDKSGPGLRMCALVREHVCVYKPV